MPTNPTSQDTLELVAVQLDRMHRQLEKQDAKLDKTLLQLSRNTSDIWWIKAIGSGIMAGVGLVVSYIFPAK